MVKRMKRTKRIGTDFASPSAHPYPPQAAKIRFYPFHPFHPFSNPAALACPLPPLKTPDSTLQFVIRHSKNSSFPLLPCPQKLNIAAKFKRCQQKTLFTIW